MYSLRGVLSRANEKSLVVISDSMDNQESSAAADDSNLVAAAMAARATQIAKLRSSTNILRTQLLAYFSLVVEHDEQTPAWQEARRAIGFAQSNTGVPRSALEMQIGW